VDDRAEHSNVEVARSRFTSQTLLHATALDAHDVVIAYEYGTAQR
jgi:hypothetical protein